MIKPSFDVYRKESFSRVSIHNDSFHPQAHKVSATNSAIHRLINIPLEPEAFRKESETTGKLTALNGLKANIPLLIYRRKLKKLLAESSSEADPPPPLRRRPQSPIGPGGFPSYANQLRNSSQYFAATDIEWLVGHFPSDFENTVHL